MDLLSPEWLSWLYGKFFVNHGLRGYFVGCGIALIVFAGVFALSWSRAIDNYWEAHPPKQYAVTIPSEIPQNVTAGSTGGRLQQGQLKN